jgi:hypothetical protein
LSLPGVQKGRVALNCISGAREHKEDGDGGIWCSCMAFDLKENSPQPWFLRRLVLFNIFMHGGFTWMAAHGFYSPIRVLDTLYFNQGDKGFGHIN